jgi:hypothetical protein
MTALTLRARQVFEDSTVEDAFVWQVAEGRLGGGEEVLSDGKDGPIGSSDPKPGGHHAE